MKRDSIDKAVANARVSSQKNEEFFRQNCDFIIENTKDKEYVMTQIKEIFNAEIIFSFDKERINEYYLADYK